MSTRISQYEFENYILLPSERLLLQDKQPIPLKSKVFETLLTLVEHYGQLLTKEELMDKIWCESFVEEGNLTQNIFILRKIFGEKLHDHRFIVTVPGQGYKFVAKVLKVSDNEPEKLESQNGHLTSGHIKSLAVLPLKFLLPNDTDKEHLGLAIADSLITQLNTNQAISIRPTDSVIKYAETLKDVITIGQELAVDNILSGTIQISGDKVRANFQLHEVKTGDTVWASKIEARSTDFFELQDQIAKQTAIELASKLNNGLSFKNTPNNLDTYQTYIKYRFFWETRTEEGLLKSLNGAKEMVAAEPNFALGYTCLADSYLLLCHHLFLSPEIALPPIRQALDKALEIEPNLAEAYSTKADYCFITKDWLQAEELYQLAIKLKPNFASAPHWYSWFLTAMGRFDESLKQIEYAQMLDTNSLYLGVVRGVPLLYKREFEQAIKQFRMVLDVDPNYKRARYYLALSLFHAGEIEKGISEFEKVVVAEPIQQTMAMMGYCYGVAGQNSKAREMLRQIDDMARKRYVSPYMRAYIHLGLGEIDQALNQLEKSFDTNDIWLVWLKVDMQLELLHDEPRYKKLLQRLNFPASDH